LFETSRFHPFFELSSQKKNETHQHKARKQQSKEDEK